MRKLTTRSLELYYPEPLRAPALRMAARMEACVDRLRAQTLDARERPRVLVYMTSADFNNAYVVSDTASIPQQMVMPAHMTLELFHLFGLGEVDIGDVACHESVHYVQLQQTSGLWNVLNTITGGLFQPNSFTESWFLEGLATYYEGRLGKFTGRPSSPVWRGWFDSVVQARGGWMDPGYLSPENRALDPFGGNYLTGMHFVEYLAAKYGEAKLWALVDDQGRSIFSPFGVTLRFKHVYGRDIGSLFAEFTQSLRDGLVARERPASQKVWLHDAGYFSRFASHPESGLTALVSVGREQYSRLTLREADGRVRVERPLVELLPFRRWVLGSPTVVSGMSFSKDGAWLYLVMADLNAVGAYQARLWQVDTRTGDVTRLWDDVQGMGGSVTPDGTAYVYVRVDGDTANLMRLELATGRQQALTAFEANAPLGPPTISPDGSRMVFPVGTEAGWDLVLREPDGALRWLTQDGSFNYSPRWLDGERIVFLREHEGRLQAHVMNVATRDFVRITDAPHLVMDVAPVGTTEVAFLNRDGTAFTIDRAPVSPFPGTVTMNAAHAPPRAALAMAMPQAGPPRATEAAATPALPPALAQPTTTAPEEGAGATPPLTTAPRATPGTTGTTSDVGAHASATSPTVPQAPPGTVTGPSPTPGPGASAPLASGPPSDARSSSPPGATPPSAPPAERAELTPPPLTKAPTEDSTPLEATPGATPTPLTPEELATFPGTAAPTPPSPADGTTSTPADAPPTPTTAPPGSPSPGGFEPFPAESTPSPASEALAETTPPREAPVVVPAPDPTKELVVLTDEPYRTLEGFLIPEFRLPYLLLSSQSETEDADDLIFNAGLALAGQDRLGFHAYALTFAYNSQEDQPSLSLAYGNAQLAPWYLQVSASRVREDQRTDLQAVAFASRTFWTTPVTVALLALRREYDPVGRFPGLVTKLLGPEVSTSYFAGDGTSYGGIQRGLGISLAGAVYPKAFFLDRTMGDVRVGLDGFLGGLPFTGHDHLQLSVVGRFLTGAPDGLLEVGGISAGQVWLSSRRSTETTPLPLRLQPGVAFSEYVRGYEDHTIRSRNAMVGTATYRYQFVLDHGWASTLWLLPSLFISNLELEAFGTFARTDLRDNHRAAGGAATLEFTLGQALPLSVFYQYAHRFEDGLGDLHLFGFGL
ncbi:hypothetical protein LZ198_18585 [Myxococcus sp. K15C18031901]|nr:hypothetical protein [Myxococcus dinghuensis]MCP3100882.1 hypothetical protein [Myxococcus dinghuensis]